MIRKEKLGQTSPFSLGEEFDSPLSESIDDIHIREAQERQEEQEQEEQEVQPAPTNEDIQEREGHEQEEEQDESPEQESKEGSEEEAPEEEESQEEDVNINEAELTKVLAESWKEDGFIGEDFEITENTTIDDLFEARKSEVDNIVRNEIRSEEEQRLTSEGYTPEILETAKYIAQGMDPSLLSEANYYNRLAKIKIDGESDEDVEAKKEYVSAYFMDKGFSEDRASSFTEKSFEDGDEKELFEEARSYFDQKSKQILSSETERQQRQKKEAEQQREQQIGKINSLLDKGEIAGKKYTKDEIDTIRRSIFEKTEVVTDANGNKVRVTPFVKKRLEIQNDLEKELKYMIDFVLGVDEQEISRRERSKGSRETLKKLRAVVTKDEKEVNISSKDTPHRKQEESRPKIKREKLVGA